MAYRHVLDTHALVWYLEGNPRLGQDAKAVMDDPGSNLVLPIIALAGAAFIVERGRTGIPDVRSLLDAILADPRIEIYPLNWDVFQHTLAATAVPEMHDRQIVATALHLRSLDYTVSILTKDSTIAASALVPVAW
jgi:PIN domain nuclease of toxin-antitoxin system